MDKVNITWKKSILSTLSFFAGAVQKAARTNIFLSILYLVFIYKQRMKAAEVGEYNFCLLFDIYLVSTRD